MMCGGLTVFSPIVRNGAGPGKRVGVIGIGRLGHYAIMFAKALGAEVYAFTHSRHEEADIKKMGGRPYCCDGSRLSRAAPERAGLDCFYCKRFRRDQAFGISLVRGSILREESGVAEIFHLSRMLEMHGKFICVGAPDEPIQSVSPFSLIFNGCFFGGSKIGSKKEATMMLELAARKSIKPSIEELPMKDVSKAVKGVVENKVRYVLKQDLA
ncbi:GroES-like protein [Sanghuangporus baumii]|uniref:GroES-like protein n=1 Tax=Sanghuangporus baumii TaxID=108892 RepID=A0A9Q5N948_SANBA|nr:GroES-like protein [Sanghuangporus baumii]